MGPAGADPVYAVASPGTLQLQAAVLFDPSIKGVPYNADGTLQGIHPVDQEVALLLTTDKGSVPSAPALGTRIRVRIARCDPRQIPRIALDEVKAVLKPLLDRGDILLVSVVATTTNPITVSYVNLRDPATNLRAPLSSARTIPLAGG